MGMFNLWLLRRDSGLPAYRVRAARAVNNTLSLTPRRLYTLILVNVQPTTLIEIDDNSSKEIYK
jgi:hypothetical protein